MRLPCGWPTRGDGTEGRCGVDGVELDARGKGMVVGGREVRGGNEVEGMAFARPAGAHTECFVRIR